jgi:hypothetical protein
VVTEISERVSGLYNHPEGVAAAFIEPKSSDSFDCCLVLTWEDENQPGFGVTAREKRFDRERQSE